MTLTTEQLRAEMIEKIAVASGLRARDGRNVVAEAIYAEVVEPLLAAANREAQPVAWEMRYWNSGYNCWHEWERITAEQHAEMSVEHATDNDYEFRILYDAPPAPAVVKLPTEFHSDEGIMVRMEQVMAALALVGVKYERRGDACRAAMLAQHVISGYKLVPIEPNDEQLRLVLAVQWPASYREHLRHPLNGPKSREENERQIAIAKRQYAAMLAAAPEGGNNSPST
ncbi:hypothetical protein A8A12_01720 [Serratia marcescens]|nr:hypothetical protein A8A12_01720 [Serratia marcescens]